MIFDIGAHLGDKTKFFADQDIAVVAIEPQSFFFEKLVRKFNQYHQVKVINQAVGNQIGEASIFISSQYPTVSSLNSEFTKKVRDQSGWKSVEWDQQEIIQVTTLDQLIQIHGKPDFVKIDVEGNEHKVLEGLSLALDFLSFEFLPAYPIAAELSVHILETKGSYQYAFSPGETFRLKTDWLTSQQMLEFMKGYNDKSGDIYAKLDKKT